MSLKRVVLLFIIHLAGNPSFAQTAAPGQASQFAPPWVAQSENFLMVAFNLKPDDVRTLLPRGVEPLVNKEGIVGALLEMYETKRVSGLSGYRIAFIVVEVQGHDSREGTPGHFAVWGRAHPQEALDAFRRHFGFPYQYGEHIGIGMEQDTHVGTVGPDGKELLRVKIAPLAEQPFEGSGSVNMVGMNADSGTVKSEVPYLTRGHIGKVLGFEVRPGRDPVLKLIGKAAPAWALVSKDQVFSYSHAVFSD
jgi:hypothetical protein